MFLGYSIHNKLSSKEYKSVCIAKGSFALFY